MADRGVPEIAEEYVPSYFALVESGEFRERVQKLYHLMESCVLCPRECRVNRLTGNVGFCRVGTEPAVSSFGPHFGEEAPLVGVGGSGTIFLTGCNLGCVFCQNYDISHPSLEEIERQAVSRSDVAEMTLALQLRGCHNINFVTPTHQVAQIMDAVEEAVKEGLILPIVYNCGGYESAEVLRLLDGIVDIYMPDMKYGDNEPGKAFSGVPDYWDRNREAISEMHRQVGDLQLAELREHPGHRVAVRGLLVRHLVLPEELAHTEEVVRFLAEEISNDTYINVMGQYWPAFQAARDPRLARRPTMGEIRSARQAACDAGLWRLDKE